MRTGIIELACPLLTHQIENEDMKNYFRVMLGAKSAYAVLYREQGFIGADSQIAQDLSTNLSDKWRGFNQKYRTIFSVAHPQTPTPQQSHRIRINSRFG